jgi:prevent-host-death family protein
MRAVGLKELKNRLSEYVQLACRGERVLVTNRDRVVAELVPPEPGRADQVCDALLADLVRQGVLTPPLLRTAEPPASAPAMPLGELLEDLSRDRDER